MPYDYEILPAQNLAVVSASGRVTGADILATIQRMSDDGRWTEGMHQICDYKEIASFAISIPELREIVGLEKLYFEDTKNSKLALLAEGFEVRIICELFCLKTRLKGRSARVFRSREEAVAWLDMPADQA